MLKKILAVSVSLVVFLIFWEIGLVIVISTGFPILVGMILWTLLAGKVFSGVFGALT